MDILEIEGIGPEYHKKLSAAGIHTTEELLKRGATPASRKEIEEATGIGHNLILKWVYLADLVRINGVGEEYSELLQAAGINTVSDLAKQNADKLFDKIIEINNKKNIVEQIPALPMIRDWISQSKNLPIIIATSGIDKKSKPVTQKRSLSVTFIILFGLTFIATFISIVIAGIKDSPLLSISIPLLIFGVILLIILAALFGVNTKKNEKRAKGFKFATLYTGITTFVSLILLIIGSVINPALPSNSTIANESDTVIESTVAETVSTSTVTETSQTSQTVKETTAQITEMVVETTVAETTSKETSPTTVPETTPTVTIATPNGPLKVHFINVGQGDSTLIQTPEGNTMLIDGGPKESASNLVSYLNKLGIDKINVVIATHPHEDHIGGLINVFNNFTVDNVIDSGVSHTTQTYKDYLSTIQAKNINFVNWSLGQVFDIGNGVSFKIVGPITKSSSDLNNSSIVIYLTYGSTSFLFAGDAESKEEGQIVSSGANIDADILKVGHHGSDSSSTIKFLNAVSPDIAVISCGISNSYGHPNDITLKNLTNIGAAIYRIDLTGNVVIEDNASNLIVALGNQYKYVATQVTETTKPAETVAETTAAETTSPETPAQSGAYVGSINSDVFHNPNCSYVKSILPENMIWFSSREDAIAQGKRPCKRCNP